MEKSDSPLTPVHGLAIGLNTIIHPNHAWCILFGDNLKSRGHFDIQITSEITLPANIRPSELNKQFLGLTKYFSVFSEEKSENLPSMTPNFNKLAWMKEVYQAMARITMYLGELGRCPRCKLNGSNGHEAILTCSGCKKIRYCSAECQKQDWPTHRQFCAPRFEVRARASGGIAEAISKLDSEVIWTPLTLPQQAVYVTKKIFKGELIGYFDGKVVDVPSLADINYERDLTKIMWTHPLPNGQVFIPLPEDPLSKAADPSFTSKSSRNFLEVMSSPQNVISSLGDLNNIIPYGSASPSNAAVAATGGPGTKVGLVAIRDLKVGEEIFFHRGFTYHFQRECIRGWDFPEGIKIETLPSNIYSSPAFREYVIFYYPGATNLAVIFLPNDVYHLEIYISDPATLPTPREPLKIKFYKNGDVPTAPPGTIRTTKMILGDYRKYFSN